MRTFFFARLTAPFSGQQSKKLAELLDRLILHLSRNSGRSDLSIVTRARDIQSVRSSYSQDDLATSDLPSYFTITARCASQLCSLFLGRGLIRTLIRDDLSRASSRPVGRLTRATHDRPKSRPPPSSRDNQFDGNLTGGRSSLSDGN